MKLNKQLTVDGNLYRLKKEEIRLNLFSPGTASFHIATNNELAGLVAFSLDYSNDLKPYFLGYIESCSTVKDGLKAIFCRELSSAMRLRIPLNLRNVTLEQTLNAVSEATSLKFDVGEGEYSKIISPVIYSLFTGYQIIGNLRTVYRIPKMIFQQQTDGTIYVGSWLDSNWFNKPINLSDKWKTQTRLDQSATFPAIPQIRPGAQLNNNIVTSTRLYGHNIDIEWRSSPWTNR